MNEKLKINHADSLEINDQQVILTGNVKVQINDEKQIFRLETNKLIALKDKKSGDINQVETFSRSTLFSDEYILMANKFVFLKNPQTGEFYKLLSTGNVQINNTKEKQSLNAPEVEILTKENLLIATKGVKTNMQEIKEDKETNINIFSDEQKLNLGENKKLMATGNVQTEIKSYKNHKEDSNIQISSEKQDFNLNKPTDNKQIFEILEATGNVKAVQPNDNTELAGDKLNVFMQGSEMHSFELISTNRDTENRVKQGKYEIKAPIIYSRQKAKGINLLIAKNNEDTKQVYLDSDEYKATASEAYIEQDKNFSSGINDFLLLQGNAEVLEIKKQRKLKAEQIKIRLGEAKKTVEAGLTTRVKGRLTDIKVAPL